MTSAGSVGTHFMTRESSRTKGAVSERRPASNPSSRTSTWVTAVLLASGASVACSKSEPQPATPGAQPHPVVDSPSPTASAAPTTTAVGDTALTSPPAAPSDALQTAAPTASSGGPTNQGHTANQGSAMTPNGWPLALGPAPSSAAPSPNASAGASTSNGDSNPSFGSVDFASNRESSRISGCLAQAPTERSPTRSTGTKAGGGETWRATAQGNGVLVTHRLHHACCLEGKAQASVDGHVVTIEEQLTGQPCRCVCESTIQTRVPVPPGQYDVQTVTVTNGQRRVVQSQRVTVGGAPTKR